MVRKDGTSGEIVSMEWQNCGGNIRFNPNEIVRSATTEEVIAIVKTGRKIRCIGTGHSRSKLAPTDDILIETDGLNKILSVNKTENQATIQAGAKFVRPEHFSLGRRVCFR